MRKTLLPLFVALTLSACAQPLPPAAEAPAASVAQQAQTVTAVLSLELRDAADRRVLAALTPWTKSDIHHVNLALYRGAATTPETSFQVGQQDLTRTIRMKGLATNSDFRIEARAFADAAEATPLDNAAVDPASCTTTFSTTTDAVVNVGAVKLRLRNKDFSGTSGMIGIDVTDGTVIEPTASASIVLE